MGSDESGWCSTRRLAVLAQRGRVRGWEDCGGGESRQNKQANGSAHGRLNPELAEQPTEDAVFERIVTAAPLLDVHVRDAVAGAKPMVEQDIRSRQSKAPRGKQQREEESPEPASEPCHARIRLFHAGAGITRRTRKATSSSNPKTHTTSGPVGRSYLNEMAMPPAEASTPANQEMMVSRLSFRVN